MDWTPKKIQQLFHLSSFITKNPESFSLKGRILVEAFFEPSTRTALSFEAAMKRLGGEVVHFHPQASSLKKGETVMDTMKTLSNYGDAIVLRHGDETVYDEVVKKVSSLPVINAGNGIGGHPTQALLDLYTMYNKFGMDFRFKSVLIVGDIKYSRTVHSLVQMMNLYPFMRVHMYPYEGCEPSDSYVSQVAQAHSQDEDEIVIPRNCLYYGDYDVIYITRNQVERHEEAQSNEYVFTTQDVESLKSDSIILHPFPRNHEISEEVDVYPQAYYFQQMKYGVEIRMGLLCMLLHKDLRVMKKHYVKRVFENSNNHQKVLILLLFCCMIKLFLLSLNYFL